MAQASSLVRLAVMPVKRKRDIVTPPWLADSLDPFIATGGQSWLRYDHNPSVKKAKTDKAKVEAAIPWILKLEGKTTLKKKLSSSAWALL